jgi:hemoglobin
MYRFIGRPTSVSQVDFSYGVGDGTYQAAGAEQGIRALVDAFYDIMAANPAYADIWQMHPSTHEMSRDKLARFLCAWTGGPKLFGEKYGPISIPNAHRHLKVNCALRDQWLDCMRDALLLRQYPDSFREYMLTQLAVPAERVRQLSEITHDSSAP